MAYLIFILVRWFQDCSIIIIIKGKNKWMFLQEISPQKSSAVQHKIKSTINLNTWQLSKLPLFYSAGLPFVTSEHHSTALHFWAGSIETMLMADTNEAANTKKCNWVLGVENTKKHDSRCVYCRWMYLIFHLERWCTEVTACIQIKWTQLITFSVASWHISQ